MSSSGQGGAHRCADRGGRIYLQQSLTLILWSRTNRQAMSVKDSNHSGFQSMFDKYLVRFTGCS
jgi:hypothetical protein